jgi:hypothetical protein
VKHNDFDIGLEFWCGDRQWRCTDIGRRTIIAIRIDGAEITQLRSGARTTVSLSRQQAEAEGWSAAHELPNAKKNYRCRQKKLKG